MKRIFRPQFLILLAISQYFIFNVSVFSQKRGIAYGYHSPDDLQVQSPNTSWWYNWYVEPEISVANVYGDYGFEFVPMAWNGNFDETKLRNFLAAHPETKYLLAFNEPNFVSQANMTPAQAAAQWPRLEAIADDFNLKIVAPAVNYCEVCVEANGVVYSDPIKYLDDFFTACPGCRVDYIAAHSYMNTVGALQWYMGRFKKYGKPIWLTEFAGWESNGNITSPDDQISFMIGAVDMLEADTSIFRYSWFIGRGPGISNYPYIDILGANGVLTPIGEVYKQMPVHDPDQIINIPGMIESENYNSMSGILLELTEDVSGFANVGYIEAGDWLEYKINVPQTDEYDIGFRIASTKPATLSVLVDGNSLLTVNFPNTSGWQNWQTVPGKIGLPAGTHTFRLLANTDGFNINWFQIGDESAVPETHNILNHDFSISQSLTPGLFTIKTNAQINKFAVYNLPGLQIQDIPFSSEINLQGLRPGIYILSAIDQHGKIITNKRISILK